MLYCDIVSSQAPHLETEFWIIQKPHESCGGLFCIARGDCDTTSLSKQARICYGERRGNHSTTRCHSFQNGPRGTSAACNCGKKDISKTQGPDKLRRRS